MIAAPLEGIHICCATSTRAITSGKMSCPLLRESLFIVILLLFGQFIIAGCGGGDGDNGEAVVPDKPGANGPEITRVEATPSAVKVSERTSLSAIATDVDTELLNYSWEKVSGEGTVSFDDQHADTATAQFSQAGVYVLSVTVSDGESTTTGNVEVTVTDPSIPNRAPVANSQNILTTHDTPVNIVLTASDADQNSLTYFVVANPNMGVLTETPPSLTYTPNPGISGTDTFTFTANDGTVDSSPATVTIEINAGEPENQPPRIISQTTAVPASIQAGEEITLSVTAEDPEGQVLSYRWEKISGPDGETIESPGTHTTKVTSLPVGDYQFQVTVSDAKQEVTSLPVAVTVWAKPIIEKPNILFIYADDLGYADISYNSDVAQSYPQFNLAGEAHHSYVPFNFARTPNIDKIYENGIVLTNYHTHQVCSPSRAGFLTGRHYTEVGAGQLVGGTLDSSVPTVAKDFQKNGYATGAFGKWHNGGNIREFGFDEWAGFKGGGQDCFDRLNDSGWYENDMRLTQKIKGYTTYLLRDYVKGFIRNHKSESFFAYLPFTAVHSPHDILNTDLKEMCDIIDDEYPHLAWEYVGELSAIKDDENGQRLKIKDKLELRCSGAGPYSKTKLDEQLPGFDKLVFYTMVHAMDKAVGEILDELINLNLDKKTIVVFSSDNGSNHGDNGPFYGWKTSYWEGAQHVPAAIWWPETMDKASVASVLPDGMYPYMTQFTDWYPTLIDAANLSIDPTAELTGTSFWQALRTGTPARGLWDFDKLYYTYHKDRAIVTNDKYKLHYNHLPAPHGVTALYNLEADLTEDPDQHVDVARDPAYADDLQRLKDAVDSWYSSGSVSSSFMKVPENLNHFHNAHAFPQGDVFEVKVLQDTDMTDVSRQSLYMSFAMGNYPQLSRTDYINGSDYLQYDICVANDSEQVKGCLFSPSYTILGKGNIPLLNEQKGIALQRGLGANEQTLLAQQVLPKGTWIRCIVGIGDGAPYRPIKSMVGFVNPSAGYYHYYLDNIKILKPDGSIRAIVWENARDTKGSIEFYYHQKEWFTSFDDALSSDVNFVFKNLEYGTVDASGIGGHIQGVGISSPRDGETFTPSDSIQVSVGAKDNIDGVQRVTLWKKLKTAESFEEVGTTTAPNGPYQWNIATLPEGIYEFKATSVNRRGVEKSSTITIHVAIPKLPVVTFTAPANLFVHNISDNLLVRVDAHDDHGLGNVKLQAQRFGTTDWIEYEALPGRESYFQWDLTGKLTAGRWKLQAIAQSTDQKAGGGFEETAASIWIDVKN